MSHDEFLGLVSSLVDGQLSQEQMAQLAGSLLHLRIKDSAQRYGRAERRKPPGEDIAPSTGRSRGSARQAGRSGEW